MKKPSILGTFRGKCCDAEIVNNNGMLLDRELFNYLVNSEEYKTAMKNRYYIGFLGHPEDPNCMDFRNACIIMTSMEMLENGEIWGTFDLVDTPVGRIVKSFIDAGVVFGISIRGAGDVDATGRVDPETFVFRGYDLVTFPAYNDAVPTFESIAASSDIEKQQRYKSVCNAVKKNLSKVMSCEALEVMQAQFNEASDEYNQIGERIAELALESEIEVEENISLLQQKLDAMTNLYLEQMSENQKLFDENNKLKLQITQINSNSNKKIHKLDRITSSQLSDLEKALTAAENKCMTLVAANTRLKDQNQKYVTACSDLEDRLKSTQEEMRSLRRDNRDLDSQFSSIKASSERNTRQLENDITDLEDELQGTKEELEATQQELKEIKNSNLIYKRKIESTSDELQKRDRTISGLKSQLRETVTANEKLDTEASNRDEEVKSLQREVSACQRIIEDYQQAYANMCADAVGTDVGNISITGKTTAKELRKLIFGSTSTSGMNAKPIYAQPEQIEMVDEEYSMDDDSLISL